MLEYSYHIYLLLFIIYYIIFYYYNIAVGIIMQIASGETLV